MEWEIITKEIIDDKGQVVIVETPEQIDSVGNIYQKTGGVLPKACQKCKKKFNSKIEELPITQDVGYFQCNDCEFGNGSGEAMLMHLQIKTKHSFKRTIVKRVVKTERISTGRTPYITKLEDDVLILCGECRDNKS